MKPEDFKKLIRLAVQEELKKQLPQLVPQILAEALTGKPKQTVRAPVAPVKSVAEKVSPAKPKELKKYVANPLLNQILNETVVRIKPENSMYVGYTEQPTSEASADFNVSDEGLDDTIDYSELTEAIKPTTPIVVNIRPANEEQAKVLGKINRDFRSIMKAVDAQKKNGANPFGGRLEFDS